MLAWELPKISSLLACMLFLYPSSSSTITNGICPCYSKPLEKKIQYRFETLSSNLLSVCNSSLPSYTLDHVLSLFHNWTEVDFD